MSVMNVGVGNVVELTCLMMTQNESGLELRSSDDGGILPSDSE